LGRILGIISVVTFIAMAVFVQNQRFVWSSSPVELIAEFREHPVQNGDTTGKKPFTALIMKDTSNISSVNLSDNISASLNHMKFDVELFDSDSDELPDLAQYDLVIFAKLLAEKYTSSIEKALEYASEGGRLFFAFGFDLCPTFKHFAPMLGITEPISSFDTLVSFDTINIEQSFAPGLAEGTSAEGWAVSGYAGVIRLKDDAEVLISYEMQNSMEVPLLWKYNLGEGNIIVSNSQILAFKENRGVIAGAVMNAFDVFIYPVFDSIVVFIDDFPAPIQRGYFDIIQREYDRDIFQFFTDIWWPDMLRTAASYNLRYTGLLITTYNDIVVPPFNPEDNMNELSLFASSLLANGHELGLHGYNHNSLMLEGSYGNDVPLYPPWPSTRNMELALEQLLSIQREMLPNYDCVTYVPPSNLLSEEGRQALLATIPQLYVISGLYFYSEVEGAYVRDFGVSPDGIVELPRISSGMKMNSSEMWNIYNGIAQYGIVSHFIHPDDILDPERGFGLDWESLSRSFNYMLDDIRSAVPNIRGKTAVEAAIEIEKVASLDVYQKTSPGRLDVALENFRGEVHFYAKLPSAPIGTIGCIVERVNAEYNSLYLIKAYSPNFTIFWDEIQ